MNRIKYFTYPILLVLLSANIVFGQIRAGAAFLKMLPGGRLQSMAASHTAVLDEPHAIFANPGAAGFLREWQLAATYTKWLADVYNASLIMGKGVRTPWSQRTRFAIGLLYQGVPEFNSTNQDITSASANDMVASLSVGQPLSLISDNISVGSSLKYLRSKLDNFDADAWMVDVGLNARTHRFGLGNSIFPQGIFSAGIALSHVGQDLTFDRVGTPLPRTFRGGLAFIMGTHDGMQLLFSSEYYKVKDEDGAVSVGTELTLNRTISFNGGIDFGADLLKEFSFGASLRLDDINTVFGSELPGRNKALRLDFASLDDVDFFNRTYRGTASHYPIHPEGFQFLNYFNDDTVLTDNITLKWESSRDPDLFDDVEYALVVDKDRSKLEQLINKYDEKADDFYLTLKDAEYLVNYKNRHTSFLMYNLTGGDYYWSVLAIDKDEHIRFASKNSSRIAHFFVPQPDIKIKDIQFEYSPWITQDDYHGIMHVTIQNSGDRKALDFELALSDSVIDFHAPINETSLNKESNNIILQKTINQLAAGDSLTIDFEWHTSQLGQHSILAFADKPDKLGDPDRSNNSLAKNFYTIPKGLFTTADEVPVLMDYQVVIFLPVITEVTFEENNTTLHNGYLENTVFDPPLKVIAERLVDNPHLKVKLQGFSDPNSEQPSVTLSDSRSQAIKAALLDLGVKPNQIRLLPGAILPQRRVPKDPTDAKWVFEERRYVKITTDQEGEQVLFAPVKLLDDEILTKVVPFESDIKHAVPVTDALVICNSTDIADTLSISANPEKDLVLTIPWQPTLASTDKNAKTDVTYDISLIDTLNRHFRNREQFVTLTNDTILRETNILVPLVYAGTKSVNTFLWDDLYNRSKVLLDKPTVRVNIQGHACKIGPDNVNRDLSDRRSRRFYQEFRAYIEKTYKDHAADFFKHVEEAKGYGEDVPLQITRLKGDPILIGDNEKSIGRKLNRRIAFRFYLVD